MTRIKQPQNISQPSRAGGHKSQAGKPNSAVRTSIPPARKRQPRKPVLPRLSPYAETLINRKAEIENQKRAAELLAAAQPSNADRQASKDWLSTPEASRISGYSVRQIQNLCDNGFFLEGEEWKQYPPRPGIRRGGIIRIRASALKKLDGIVN